jgi:glycosyltransferase involved in cell wall biosynthesis
LAYSRSLAPPANPDLSVVVLCYQAGQHAHAVVEPLYDELEASGVDYELILVANYWPGDKDVTPASVEQLARGRERVQRIARPKEGAMGWDMRSGLERGRGRHLVVIDGDGQVPVQYALEIYRRLTESGADIVKGRRVSRLDGWLRTVLSAGYNALFRLMFMTKGVWDINGRPKALTRSAYEQLDLRTDDWFTDAEIVLKARRYGLTLEEMPVRFLANEERASFVGPATVWEFLVNMIRWRLGRHPAALAARDRAKDPRVVVVKDRR